MNAAVVCIRIFNDVGVPKKLKINQAFYGTFCIDPTGFPFNPCERLDLYCSLKLFVGGMSLSQ